MTHMAFDRRLRALARKHDRMTLGITYRIGRDGLITAHPRRRIAPRFPLKSLMGLVLAAFGFKIALFALLGAETYGARLAQLQTGSAVEQAGAWLMQPDPVTLAGAAVVDAFR
jgi:hypothetical protein